ncbi:putative ATP:guanido phosphotransferase, glutamine synthetase/guanido kinase, catalytic [Plasmopara halstedii]
MNICPSNLVCLLLHLQPRGLAGEYLAQVGAGALLVASTTALPSQENNFPNFTPKHRSLMAKHLTKTLYDKLKYKHSSKGYTLDMAIQTGINNPHLRVGVVAGDEERYQVFKDSMTLCIEGWYGYKPEDKHLTDMDVSKLENAEMINNAYVQSIRVGAGRNIRGLSLPPGTTHSERLKVKYLLATGLSTLTVELKG